MIKGKKTKNWERVRADLKKKFWNLEVTYCELGFKGCWRDNALGFAHGDKRRFLTEDELENLVILACNPCHQKIEELPRSEMREIVEKTIAKRQSLLRMKGLIL